MNEIGLIESLELEGVRIIGGRVVVRQKCQKELTGYNLRENSTKEGFIPHWVPSGIGNNFMVRYQNESFLEGGKNRKMKT